MKLKERFLQNKPLSCCLLANALPFAITFICGVFDSHISKKWRHWFEPCFEYSLYISIICMIITNLYLIWQMKELLRYKLFFSFLFIAVFLPFYSFAYVIFIMVNALAYGDLADVFAVH